MQTKIQEINQRALAAGLTLKSYNDNPDRLVCRLGILATETFAYRNKYNALKVGKVAAEDLQFLDKQKKAFKLKNKTSILYNTHTLIQQNEVSLDAWYIYFRQSFENVDIKAFNNNLHSRETGFIPLEQLQKAFDYKVIISRGDATDRQLETIRNMILEKKLVPASQDDWSFMTKVQASLLIGSVIQPSGCKKQASKEAGAWLADFNKLPEEIQKEIRNNLK